MHSRGRKPAAKPSIRTHDTTNKSETRDTNYDYEWTRLRDDSQLWDFVRVVLNLNSSYQSVRCVLTAAHSFVL